MRTAPRKQCSVCSWETGTLVFATLNLITLAAGVVGGVAGFLVTVTNWDQWDLNLLSLGCAVLSGFLMVFAVLLFHGVLKKTPEHIKAYFVFGVCMLSLSFFATAASATFLDGWLSPIPPIRYWDSTAIAAIVIGQVVYLLILAMIYKTYKKMETAAKDEQTHFLIENMNEKFVMPSYFKA